MAGLPREKPQGLDSPLVPKLLKYASKVHVWTYRRTNGRVGSKWRIGAGWHKPVQTLLLDHAGRTSGTQYCTPLLYLVDGPDLVVVGSQGGLPTHPQWYRNLVATPDTRVQVLADVRPVRARTADPEERAALWPRLVELYADFDSYAQWTDREIPVVILEPR